jgi:hypothetical protein
MSGKSYVVLTNGLLPCDAQRAWEKVCFYEHISVEPSWLLRTVLPVPLRTTGAYRNVGDVSRCQYSDGGYLTKQIRNIVAGARIEFDIIEQSIRYAGSIALKGGSIQIEPRDDGACSVEMLTRYELRSPWLGIARVCIDRVVSAMHQIVLRDMRMRLELRPHTSVSGATCDSGGRTGAVVGARLRGELGRSEFVHPNRT